MNGLVYTYPDGRKAGIAYDTWQTFLKNRDQYIALGKEFPSAYVVDQDYQGNTYEFKFNFENPFTPISFKLIQVPLVTPEGILLDPGEDLSEPTIITDPITPDTPPLTIPDEPSYTISQEAVYGMVPMGLLALGMLIGQSRRKTK